MQEKTVSQFFKFNDRKQLVNVAKNNNANNVESSQSKSDPTANEFNFAQAKLLQNRFIRRKSFGTQTLSTIDNEQQFKINDKRMEFVTVST